MISTLLHRLAACGLLLPASCFAQPWFDARTTPQIAVEELRPGMVGEVWTVFAGTEPEPFQVEYAGTIENALGPGRHMILCRLTDPRVQPMGAVAGMSGSPLYFDGRLAGALSYSVQIFETVRHAGFTPIADILAAGAPPGAAKAGSTTVFTPLQPALTLSGLSPAAAAWAIERFAERGLQAVPGGGSAVGEESSRPFRPGDAVAVALASGDITIAGTGTVSYVDGDRVYAFGHPIFGLGDVDFPMAHAEIVTIAASSYRSYKVSNTRSVVGAIRQDRLSAIAGEVGQRAATVPVRVAGKLASRPLRFEVVRDRDYLPLVTAIGMLEALAGTNVAGRREGVRIDFELDFGFDPPLRQVRFYDATDGAFETALGFLRDLTALLRTPVQPVFPSSIAVHAEGLGTSPFADLASVHVPMPAFRPGETLRGEVSWRRLRGVWEQRTFAIRLDPSWTGRKLELVVGSGEVLDQLRGRQRLGGFTVAPGQIRDSGDLLRALSGSLPTDTAYAAVIESARVLLDATAAVGDAPESVRRIARTSDPGRFRELDTVRVLALVPIAEGIVLRGSERIPIRVEP